MRISASYTEIQFKPEQAGSHKHWAYYRKATPEMALHTEGHFSSSGPDSGSVEAEAPSEKS
ncbi:UNVERIFIED_CONTAM: hypothetical protein FKN15_001984 [Acipenser sinensis]